MSSNCANFFEELKFYQEKHPIYFKNYEDKITLNTKIKLIAFYLPQFHTIPENDLWWGKGFTEWTNVTKGIPVFTGHYQPRLPGDLGFYNLNDIEIMKKQVQIAKNYGIYGFCFHYFWFSGRRLLERPLDNFLKNDINFPFCLCWANENWTRRWDGQEQEILIEQKYNPTDPLQFLLDIRKYFDDPRYIKINGRHVLIIYRADKIPNVNLQINKWKEQMQTWGYQPPLIIIAQSFRITDPFKFNGDVAIEFPPHGLQLDDPKIIKYDKNFSGKILKQETILNMVNKWQVSKYPIIRTVFPSWDNYARRKNNSLSMINFDLQKYSQWLNCAIQWSINQPIYQNNLVFINAWNEWAEGAYLEPDRHYGYAVLDATYDILKNYETDDICVTEIMTNPEGAFKIIMIDENKKMSNILRRQFGVSVQTLSIEDIDNLIQIKEKGYSNAILNCSVSKHVLDSIVAAGIKIITIVDTISSETSLQIDTFNNSSLIIFNSIQTQKQFNILVEPELDKQTVINNTGIDYDEYCFSILKTIFPELEKISVIIPNYNYARYLEQRFQSILNQRYPIFELIFLDDCSSDDSIEIFNKIYKTTGRKFKSDFNHVNSSSVFNQWKKGIDLARGDYIWIAEADDSSENTFLEIMIEDIKQSNNIGLAYCQSKQINGDGKHLGNDYHAYTNQVDKFRWKSSYLSEGHDEIKYGLSQRCTIMNASSVLFLREAIKNTIDKEIDYIKQNFKVAGDWWIYIKLLQSWNISYNHKNLNIHRRHKNSVVATNDHRGEVEIILKYLKDIVYGD